VRCVWRAGEPGDSADRQTGGGGGDTRDTVTGRSRDADKKRAGRHHGRRRLPRSHSTSPPITAAATTTTTTSAAAAAAAVGVVEVDLVSLQTALRRFTHQLIAAESQRVSKLAVIWI